MAPEDTAPSPKACWTPPSPDPASPPTGSSPSSPKTHSNAVPLPPSASLVWEKRPHQSANRSQGQTPAPSSSPKTSAPSRKTTDSGSQTAAEPEHSRPEGDWPSARWTCVPHPSGGPGGTPQHAVHAPCVPCTRLHQTRRPPVSTGIVRSLGLSCPREYAQKSPNVNNYLT